MFRRHQQPEAVRTIDLTIPDSGEAEDLLRQEQDPDPFIEAATQRLREQLGSLSAVDEWGRPLAWRQVARIALGPLVTARVRDAVTADVLAEAVVADVPAVVESLPEQPAAAEARSVSPEGEVREAEWRSFFRAIDESDRLLGDQPRALPDV